MTSIMRRRDIPLNESYEPGLHIELGVLDKTVGSQNILMGHTTFPPGNKNQWHIHTNCEAAQYVISGRLRVKWVENGVVRSEVLEAGDFNYISRNDPHTQENASDTEPVEIIFAYSGANSTDNAGTEFITPPAGES